MAVKQARKTGTASATAEAPSVLEQTAAEKFPVAVMAYAGTVDLMERLWKKFCTAAFKVIEVPEGTGAADALAMAVADSEVDDVFVYLPPNMVPCCDVDVDDMSAPYVYYTLNPEGPKYSDRYPMKFSKAELVEALADEDLCADDERFLSSYFKAHRHRPIRCGYNIGNLVMPVRRGNPCENKVIEGFLRYRFVSCTPEGFDAIALLCEKMLLA